MTEYKRCVPCGIVTDKGLCWICGRATVTLNEMREDELLKSTKHS